MSRPTYHSHREQITREAAAVLAPKIADWSDGDTSEEEILPHIERALRYHTDGYELARKLDDMSYTPDSDLVEILAAAPLIKSQILDRLQAEWVKETGATGPELGSMVAHIANPSAGLGKVLRHHPDGRSTVCFPDLGHKEDPGPNGGKVGLVLPWEHLKAA